MKALVGLLALIPSLAVAAERPKLAVLLIIDQLPARVFEARLPGLTGGIKRLATEGTRYREAHYETAPTFTGPGHSTLATGAWPQVHGVVSNEWFDREKGAVTLSVEDSRYTILGRAPVARECTAPTQLLVPGLADAVKASDARSKVLTVAAKDRAAILTGGRGADLALWFDSEAPVFVTSSWYAKEAPAWLAPVNAQISAALTAGMLQPALPGGGATGAAPKAEAVKGRVGDSEPFAERPEWQPLLEKATVDVALAGVQALELGRDDSPDLLILSFSGHDRIGHAFGPDSPEAEKELKVIDAEVGRLLKALDASVGAGRYVVALSADHGGGQAPEVLTPRRLDAGRIDTKALRAALEAEAKSVLGAAPAFEGFWAPGFFAKAAARPKLLAIAPRLRAVALKQPGVADLLAPTAPGALEGPVGGYYARGYHPERSPDFIVVPKAYWHTGKDIAAHGTAYLYDRAVPLIFFGAGIRAARLPGVPEAVDVAPTLAALLQLGGPPATQGRVLELTP